MSTHISARRGVKETVSGIGFLAILITSILVTGSLTNFSSAETNSGYYDKTEPVKTISAGGIYLRAGEEVPESTEKWQLSNDEISDGSYYIVQFNSPPTFQDRLSLNYYGMDFIQYLSASSWLTFVHPWTLDILETNSDIVFYTLYQPVYKVQDSLFEKSTDSIDVIITSARGGLYDRSDLLFELDAMDARLISVEGPGSPFVKASIPFSELHKIATIEDVITIDEFGTPLPLMDLMRSADYMGVDPVQMLSRNETTNEIISGQFTGQGILGQVREGGMEFIHPDLTNNFYDDFNESMWSSSILDGVQSFNETHVEVCKPETVSGNGLYKALLYDEGTFNSTDNSTDINGWYDGTFTGSLQIFDSGDNEISTSNFTNSSYLEVPFEIDGNGPFELKFCIDSNFDEGSYDILDVSNTFYNIDHGWVRHGTSVAGIMFGTGNNNLQATGMLPEAEGSFGYLLNSSYESLGNLWRGEFNDGTSSMYNGLFQQNSWRNALGGNYNSAAADSDLAISTYPHVLQSFSAGNYAYMGSTDSMSDMASAKNIISVGGLWHEDTATLGDDYYTNGNGASRGPTVDNRVKPDLVGPYSSIYTIDMIGSNGYSNTNYTSGFGGTSGAGPVVVATSGILYQMYMENFFDNNPEENIPLSSTIKALMFADAYQYPMNDNNLMYRNIQGWGTPDIERSYNLGSEGHFFVDGGIDLEAGDSWSEEVYVDGGTSLKVSMVWIDPAASTYPEVCNDNDECFSRSLVNNLDLKLTSPSGMVYYGNNGLHDSIWSVSDMATNDWSFSDNGFENHTEAYLDDLNNVENVFIQVPESGIWTVEVSARDGDLGTPEGPQDFSLVASGIVRDYNPDMISIDSLGGTDFVRGDSDIEGTAVSSLEFAVFRESFDDWDLESSGWSISNTPEEPSSEFIDGVQFFEDSGCVENNLELHSSTYNAILYDSTGDGWSSDNVTGNVTITSGVEPDTEQLAFASFTNGAIIEVSFEITDDETFVTATFCIDSNFDEGSYDILYIPPEPVNEFWISSYYDDSEGGRSAYSTGLSTGGDPSLSSQYMDNSTSTLSHPLDIEDYQNPYIVFDYMVDANEGEDFLEFEAFAGGNGLASEIFSGSSDGWESAMIDITPGEGDLESFSFTFSSSAPYLGIYFEVHYDVFGPGSPGDEFHVYGNIPELGADGDGSWNSDNSVVMESVGDNLYGVTIDVSASAGQDIEYLFLKKNGGSTEYEVENDNNSNPESYRNGTLPSEGSVETNATWGNLSISNWTDIAPQDNGIGAFVDEIEIFAEMSSSVSVMISAGTDFDENDMWEDANVLGTSWSYAWSTSDYVDGDHSIKAQVCYGDVCFETEASSIRVDNTRPHNPDSFTSNIEVNTWSSVSDIYVEWSGAYDLNGEIAGYSAIWNKESSSIPPAEISTTDSNLSFTVDETGEYYVHIRAVDSTGYWNNSVYTIGPFKIDLTNPEVSIDSPSNYQYFNTDTITVSWGGSDDHSGVDYYELYVYDADGNFESYEGTFTWNTQKTLTLSEGVHSLQVIVYDIVGHSTADSIMVIIDLTDPTVAITSPNEGSYHNSMPVSFTWDGSDSGTPLSDVASYEIKFDDGQWSAPDNSNSHSESFSDGTHTVSVKVTDLAGNQYETSLSFITDLTNPSVSISSPEAGFIVSSTTLQVSWSGSDETSGIDYYSMSVNSGPWQNLGSDTSFDFTDLSNGDYTVDIMITDVAGNSASDSVSFTIDISSPSVSFTYPSDGAEFSVSSVTVTWDGSDSQTWLSSYDIRIDEGVWESVDLDIERTFANLSEGMHTVDVMVYDAAGNTMNSTVSFVIDTVSPGAELEVMDELYGTAPISIEWTTYDNTTGVSHTLIKFDDGEWTDMGILTESQIPDLQDGMHEITIRVVDNVDNSYETSVSFNLDTTAPTLTADIDIQYRLVDEGLPVEFSWATSDENSGIDYLEIRIFGTYVVEGVTQTVDTTFAPDSSLQDFIFDSDYELYTYGEFTVTISAYDVAGNVQTTSINFEVKEGGIQNIEYYLAGFLGVTVLISALGTIFSRKD